MITYKIIDDYGVAGILKVYSADKEYVDSLIHKFDKKQSNVDIGKLRQYLTSKLSCQVELTYC